MRKRAPSGCSSGPCARSTSAKSPEHSGRRLRSKGVASERCARSHSAAAFRCHPGRGDGRRGSSANGSVRHRPLDLPHRGAAASRGRHASSKERLLLHPRRLTAARLVDYSTNSISPGRQVFSIQGSSGPYRRRMTNQPLPGIVFSQFFSKPFGGLGAK